MIILIGTEETFDIVKTNKNKGLLYVNSYEINIKLYLFQKGTVF